MKTSVYLNIGTNSGDRREFISRAVAALRLQPVFADALCRCSDVIETPAWGFESQYPFMNIGVAFHFQRHGAWTPAELESLLKTTQAVEKLISDKPHRNADGSYRDREIDIDIIAVDDIVYSSPTLVIPHPRAHLRDFVIIPLRQLGKSI